MANIDFDDCIETALENVGNDRALALKLLTDLMTYINGEDARHKEMGLTAAKYLETLQRSNEQLVKISNMLHKHEEISTDLSAQEKQTIFDFISFEPAPEEE